MGDKGQAEFEERLRKLFQALVQLMADVKNETLLTQVLKILKLLKEVRNSRGAMKFPFFFFARRRNTPGCPTSLFVICDL